MSHVVDTVQVLSPLLIIQVLPLASDNLNRVLRIKESAGRAVGTGKESTALSEDRRVNSTHYRPLHSFLILEWTKACRARCNLLLCLPIPENSKGQKVAEKAI